MGLFQCSMMQDHSLPDALRQDVRHYFFECEHLWKFQRRGELIERMSPSLKGRVTLALMGHRGPFKREYRGSIGNLENAENQEKTYFCIIWQLGGSNSVQNTPTGCGNDFHTRQAQF